MFPIVLSAPHPFHLFVRDEADKWTASIKDINTNSYDPLKLHRVSFFLDVGLENGTPMGFGFDGSMIIPRNPSLQSADDAMDSFNKVKAALLLGGLQMEQTTSSQLAFGEMSEHGYFRYSIPHGFASQLNHALGENAAGSLLSVVLENPKRVVQSDVEKAFEVGNQIIAQLSALNSAFLVTAFSNAKNHEYRSALIFGWVATEQAVEQLWLDYFLEDIKIVRLPGRKKDLKEFRNISQKIEMLFQANFLSDQAYDTLRKARKARNEFAHKGGRVSRDDALACLTGLLTVINAYAELSGLNPIGLVALEALKNNDMKAAGRKSLVMKADDLDWSNVKYWRKIFPIPGDANWKENGQCLDGIRLMDASDELKAGHPHTRKKPH